MWCRLTSAIDNPDEESELALLQAYAPSVSVDVLRRLCKAFAELRELVENGTLTYPYSTREAVAVAKHLEKFPNDGIRSVLVSWGHGHLRSVARLTVELLSGKRSGLRRV